MGGPDRHGARWPDFPALSEDLLFRGYGIRAASDAMIETRTPPETAADVRQTYAAASDGADGPDPGLVACICHHTANLHRGGRACHGVVDDDDDYSCYCPKFLAHDELVGGIR